MKVLFVTNIPSPYRVDFFNELGKYCQLTVCFEREEASDRNKQWIAEKAINYTEIYADVRPIKTEKSKGKGIVRVIQKEKFDRLIIAGYSSPSVAKAILYCRRHKIPFYMESDGGFYKKDGLVKRIVKKFLLCGAQKHLTTCQEHIRYLQSIGIEEYNIYKYPFTSVKQAEILEKPLPKEEREQLKTELGIQERKVVLSVGQFVSGKGYDVLLKAVQRISRNIGVYIVGGQPTEEYLSYQKEYKLDNVHFISFKKKAELQNWYKLADLFVLPTRSDIWGLVINEAMAKGLPVITTNKCIAGLELIENDKNGYIVAVNDDIELADKIIKLLQDDTLRMEMSKNNLRKIHEYTIENMALTHLDILKKDREL